MKVALFNVKFSPNLGDGLLAECLEKELTDSETETVTLDLAGRQDYGEGLGRHRRSVLSVLGRCPPVMRRTLVRVALGRTIDRHLRPRWRQILAGADAVVVGGGNLFADQDLNFPLKVSAALDEAARAGLPSAVFGVGVSDHWSAPGKALFGQALRQARPTLVAVRDERSRQNWARELCDAGVGPSSLCRDPGLLAARHFPAVPRPSGPQRIALGVTDPLALHYHAASVAMSEAELTRWFAALVAGLAKLYGEVLLFTNGSPEDHAYMSRIAPQLAALAPGRISTAPAFRRPAELAAFISGVDLVLAHRLHANIAAFAYGLPHIGFVWDPKLDAFFEATGRSKFTAEPCVDTPEQVLALVSEALRDGLDSDHHQRVVESARDDVARLRQSLAEAVRLRTDA